MNYVEQRLAAEKQELMPKRPVSPSTPSAPRQPAADAIAAQSDAQFDAAQFDAAQFDAAQFDAAQFDAAQSDAGQASAADAAMTRLHGRTADSDATAAERPVDGKASGSSQPVGRHLLADLYGVDPDWLRDEDWLVKVFAQALDAAGFNTIEITSHKFPGALSGVTAVALLSESHASFHTYPEHQYVALDVFSCGRPHPGEVVDRVIQALEPTRVERHLQTRGGRPLS